MKKVFDKFTLILLKLCFLIFFQFEVCKMKINMDGIILTSGIQIFMGGIILISGIQIFLILEQFLCGNGFGINFILKFLFYFIDEYFRYCFSIDSVFSVVKEIFSYYRNLDFYMIQENFWYIINRMYFICYIVSIWFVSLRN